MGTFECGESWSGCRNGNHYCKKTFGHTDGHRCTHCGATK